MNLRPGDEIVIKGHNVGDRDRIGLIVEVRGADGAPPYLVEWADRPGHHLFWPGSDAQVRGPRPTTAR